MSKKLLPIITFCFFLVLTSSLYSDGGPGEGSSDDSIIDITSSSR